MYNKLKEYLSQARLSPYIMATKTNKEAVELYEENTFISERFYTSLSFVEIFLRNVCNEKLRKEVGEGWYLKNSILFGDNKEKGQWAIDKIDEARKKIRKRKREKELFDYPIMLDDIVSNLEFSFWSNLFCANYNNTIWKPYLKFIFPEYDRKQLFKILDEIRELRNRIFHFEPIIFNLDLKEKVKNINKIIECITSKEIYNYAKGLSDIEFYIDLIQKDLDAPLNQ